MGYRWGRGRPCDLGHCLVINKRSYMYMCWVAICKGRGVGGRDCYGNQLFSHGVLSCPEIDISARENVHSNKSTPLIRCVMVWPGYPFPSLTSG